MGTNVKRCKCKHDFQDKTYGEGQRVHNRVPGESKEKCKWRCSVCGDTKD